MSLYHTLNNVSVFWYNMINTSVCKIPVCRLVRRLEADYWAHSGSEPAMNYGSGQSLSLYKGQWKSYFTGYTD